MKHLIHWAGNLVAGLSLLLCLCACALWVRSGYVCDVAYRVNAQGDQWAVCSAAGTVQVTETGALSSALSSASSSAPMPAGLPPAQPWQWVHVAAAQAGYYLWQPAPADAVWGGRALLLMARVQPIFAPGGYSGPRPPSPVTSAAILGLSFRLWLLVAVTAVLPLARAGGWYARRRRARAADRGHCARCGYDLRATPERGGPILGRCPECGTVAATANIR